MANFYDLLGVGTRTQSEVYIVSAGRISEMRTSAVTHPGGEFRPAYQGFRRWLVDTARVRDPDLVEDGGLRFTGRSAKRIRPWLERWRRTRGS